MNIRFPTRPVVIGKIAGAYGVRGWVKVISFTDKIDNMFQFDPWFVFCKTQWKPINLECWRVLNRKSYIAKICGISNREMAMLLRNYDLIIDDTQLPNLYNNEYYWKDIIGCKVIAKQGNILGYVEYIIETVAHDVLAIRLFDDMFSKYQKKDCLIPFVQNKVIKSVNLIDRIIVVDWNCNY